MTIVKRRMALLVAVSAVSGVMTLFAPTTAPAQAVPHEACTIAADNASLSSGFYYPVGNALVSPTQPSSAHSATFTFGGADCQPSGVAMGASGTVHGWCGLSVGSGTTTKGDNFHWIGAGSTLVITGQVSGAVNATPNAVAGESCTAHTPGARHFIVTGEIVRHSCGVVNTPTSQSVTSTSVSVPGVASAHINVGSGATHATVHTPAGSTSQSAPVGPGHLSIHPTYSVCA